MVSNIILPRTYKSPLPLLTVQHRSHRNLTIVYFQCGKSGMRAYSILCMSVASYVCSSTSSHSLYINKFAVVNSSYPPIPKSHLARFSTGEESMTHCLYKPIKAEVKSMLQKTANIAVLYAVQSVHIFNSKTLNSDANEPFY